MVYQKAAQSYRQAHYFTTNPVNLINLCYDGMISSLKLARAAYNAKDYEAKGKALLKAMDILHELNASLDLKKGGEVAMNLRNLYGYIDRLLTEADLKRDLVLLDRTICMLEELGSAWRSIAAPGRRPPVAEKPRQVDMPLGRARSADTDAPRRWDI